MNAGIEELRQQQSSQPDPGPDPAMDNLIEFFEELVDAVEATPAAKTARIYAAITAVRTILLNEINQRDAFAVHSLDEDMDGVNDDDHASADDASSVDLTCESEPADTSEKYREQRGGSRGAGRRAPHHFNLGQDSDPELRHHSGDQPPRSGRGRQCKSRSASPRPPRRSMSPTVPAR